MPDTEPIDIGYGITLALRLFQCPPTMRIGLALPADGEVVGVLLTHPCAKHPDNHHLDFIPIDGRIATSPARTWTLVSQDPVTLSPSVHWTCCGMHGFVVGGRWVPA